MDSISKPKIIYINDNKRRKNSTHLPVAASAMIFPKHFFFLHVFSLAVDDDIFSTQEANIQIGLLLLIYERLIAKIH